MWSQLACLLLAAMTVILLGCGGGGGESSGDTDPLAPEINARVDAFLTAINSEDLDGAMSYIDTTIKWNHGGSFWNHEDLKLHLQAFFTSASSITVQIDTREVVSDLESSALFAGRLSGIWKDGNGVIREFPVENIEIQWGRVPTNWGMLSFSGHAGVGAQFPPVP